VHWHAPCGRINGAFLKHGLIDEFSTLIFPAVDGVAGTQSIVDYAGPGRRPSRCRAVVATDLAARHTARAFMPAPMPNVDSNRTTAS
jgi:riboflavin biosynthesis pyrimidine reductase